MENGIVVSAARSGREVILTDPRGRRVRSLTTGLLEAHDLEATRSNSSGVDALWLADPGFHHSMSRGKVRETLGPGRVVLMDLEGRVFRELLPPDVDAAAAWRPTSIASSDEGIWVADGYGRQCVEFYDLEGRVAFSVDGSQTGTRFSEPHGVLLDTRSADGGLIVADRGNRRLVVLDKLGQVVRVVHSPLLDSPSGLAILGDSVLVTELRAGISRIDREWRVSNFDAGDGENRPISPHGIATGPGGEIYVSEWRLGGHLKALSLSPSE